LPVKNPLCDRDCSQFSPKNRFIWRAIRDRL